jgi:hypothetical protein
MPRITLEDIQKRLDYLNKQCRTDLSLERAALGGWRIVSRNGSRDISPCGSKRDTYNYACAMMAGVDISTIYYTEVIRDIYKEVA